jgi:hypothetical protein
MSRCHSERRHLRGITLGACEELVGGSPERAGMGGGTPSRRRDQRRTKHAPEASQVAMASNELGR